MPKDLLPVATLNEVRAMLLEVGQIAEETRAQVCVLRSEVAAANSAAQAALDAIQAIGIRLDE